MLYDDYVDVVFLLKAANKDMAIWKAEKEITYLLNHDYDNLIDCIKVEDENPIVFGATDPSAFIAGLTEAQTKRRDWFNQTTGLLRYQMATYAITSIADIGLTEERKRDEPAFGSGFRNMARFLSREYTTMAGLWNAEDHVAGISPLEMQDLMNNSSEWALVPIHCP
ncbi:MAG: hypothetical protein PHR28_12115 [candidate division Zixibacteria bacterium]|jgi:hypothetical protein|nr:hypothetical protein [candidate division Zixibacteria bacterium]